MSVEREPKFQAPAQPSGILHIPFAVRHAFNIARLVFGCNTTLL